MSFEWKDLPSLSSLRAFDATARSGSFAAAGRMLNVTHAAIAQQVRKLESDIGTKLVVRTGRTVSLTDPGARLALALSEGFETISTCVDLLRRTEAKRGLRVTSTTYIADVVILPRLSEFWAKFPGIEVALMPNRTLTDIAREGFDLGIRAGSGDWPGVDAELLVESRVLAVGAPSLVGDGNVNPAKLPWIWVANNTWEQNAMETAGLDPEALTRVDLGSDQLELAAAREGLGLAIVTEVIIRKDLEQGRLVEVPLPGLPTFNYYAVTPKGSRRPSVDSFIGWLKTIF